MGAQGEEGGDRQRERDRTEHSWYVMEPWVIFPIGAAAQKPELCQKQSLDASSHLYMRVCPSVRRSVRRSVTLLSKREINIFEQNIVIGGILGPLDASSQLYKTVYRSIGLSVH